MNKCEYEGATIIPPKATIEIPDEVVEIIAKKVVEILPKWTGGEY